MICDDIQLQTKTVANGSVKFHIETKQYVSLERPETLLRRGWIG